MDSATGQSGDEAKLTHQITGQLSNQSVKDLVDGAIISNNTNFNKNIAESQKGDSSQLEELNTFTQLLSRSENYISKQDTGTSTKKEDSNEILDNNTTPLDEKLSELKGVSHMPESQEAETKDSASKILKSDYKESNIPVTGHTRATTQEGGSTNDKTSRKVEYPTEKADGYSSSDLTGEPNKCETHPSNRNNHCKSEKNPLLGDIDNDLCEVFMKLQKCISSGTLEKIQENLLINLNQSTKYQTEYIKKKTKLIFNKIGSTMEELVAMISELQDKTWLDENFPDSEKEKVMEDSVTEDTPSQPPDMVISHNNKQKDRVSSSNEPLSHSATTTKALESGSVNKENDSHSSCKADSSLLESKDPHVKIKAVNICYDMNIPHTCLNEIQQGVTYEEKTLLLLGMPGSGKTTLVESFMSYILGIKSPDIYLQSAYRKNVKQLPKVDDLSAYTAFLTDQQLSVTFIDIPGHRDSKNEDYQNYIDKLQSFLTIVAEKGLAIHAIGLVVQAHVSRLTPVEKLIVGLTKKLSKKQPRNVISLITFADSQNTPPVINTLKDYKLSTENIFLFNNSLLSDSVSEDEQVSEIDAINWKKGLKNWRKITEKLVNLSPVSYSKIEKSSKETSTKAKIPKTDTARNTCIKKFEDKSKETTNMYFVALQDAILDFVHALNKPESRNTDFNTYRDFVWMHAELYYQYTPFMHRMIRDEWLLSLTYQICLETGINKTQINHYPTMLALARNKPLIHAGYYTIKCSECMYSYLLKVEQKGKSYMNVFSRSIINFDVLKRITLDHLAEILQNSHAHVYMNVYEFLQYISVEVGPGINYYISELVNTQWRPNEY